MSRSKQKKTHIEHVGNEANGPYSVYTGKSIENTQWAKWRGTGGHGFGAEDVNAQADRLHFAKVEVVGRSNEKDGADRIVNCGRQTTAIQTKYYQTAEASIDAAFDTQTGIYRYNGQVIEVPKDQYEDAIKKMAEKIRAGNVPGVSDPQKAESLLKSGSVTYAQAKNITKAGNIDSLKFDIIEQSVVSTCALGISFVISFASCKWNGMDTKQALRLSGINAATSGAFTMCAGILTRQFLRTQLGRNLAACSTKSAKTIVNQIYKTDLGKKAINNLASAIAGKGLTGAAAKNVVTKLARSTWPVTICMTALTAMPDLYRAAIARNISWQQFLKNLSVNIVGAVGGIAGASAGAALGAAIGCKISPKAGTAIGGAVGGFVGGMAGGIGSSKFASYVSDRIFEDDSVQMHRIIQEVVPRLSSEYLVSEDEFLQIQDEIQSLTDIKWLRKMYFSGVKGTRTGEATRFRAEYAYSELSPIFEKAAAKRAPISVPTDKEIIREFRWISFRLLMQSFMHSVARFLGIKRNMLELD